MKKYAIMLSGQLRYCENCLEHFKKNLLDVNNCDVYAFFWSYKNFDLDEYYNRIKSVQPDILTSHMKITKYMKDNEDYNLQQIKSKINFKKIILKDQILFEEKYKDTSGVTSNFLQNFIVQSQLRGINEAFKLIEGNYDGVLKCRIDVNMERPLILDKYDPSFIHIDMLSPTYALDYYVFGNYNDMKYYSQIYENLDVYFLNPCDLAKNEENIITHLRKNKNIKIKGEKFGSKWGERRDCKEFVNGKCRFK